MSELRAQLQSLTAEREELASRLEVAQAAAAVQNSQRQEQRGEPGQQVGYQQGAMSEEEEYGAEMELAAYEMATRLEEVEQQAVEALEQLEAAQRAQQEEQVGSCWGNGASGHGLCLPFGRRSAAESCAALGWRVRIGELAQAGVELTQPGLQPSAARLSYRPLCAPPTAPQERRLAVEAELDAADRQIEQLTAEIMSSHVSPLAWGKAGRGLRSTADCTSSVSSQLAASPALTMPPP